MQCKKKKRDGKQCGAPGLAGKDYCAMHSQPGRAAELGSKGGRRRAIYAPSNLKEFTAPKTAADLRDLLAESIIEIRSGRLDPRIANALGYLGASSLRALEVSDLEKRMESLEATQRTGERILLESRLAGGRQEGVSLAPYINSRSVGNVGK